MNIDENDVVLSLGDIIHITTYGNSDINNKMFSKVQLKQKLS